MHNLLQNLNQSQVQAVTYIDNPLLVIAGAGSGKTRIITSKIAYLIAKCGFMAKDITAITFTNKAATEMLTRATSLLKNAAKPCITTFHSLGLKIIREEHQVLGYKKNFSILDSYDSSKIISDILNTADKAIVKSMQNQISLWKNSFHNAKFVLQKAQNNLEIEQAQAYQQYQETLFTYQVVDFDDLIKLPVEMFESNIDILTKWQNKIRYLLVDEYQDTNECQYKLIKLITKNNNMLTVVGDDDQSIYGWRGANIQNIHNLQKDFAKLRIVKLEQNYRSTTNILNAANSIIGNNQNIFNKKLWSTFDPGQLIKIIASKNEEIEAQTIIRKIKIHQIEHDTCFSSYIVLYRSNYQSRIFEQILREEQIPYIVSNNQSFFEKSEIKDILSYLKLIVNEDDDTAFIRAVTTPKRGIGKTTLERLASYATLRNISLFAALFEEGFINQIQSQQLIDLTDFGNLINRLNYASQKQSVSQTINELIKIINYEEYLYEIETNKTADKRWKNVLSLIAWLERRAENTGKNMLELVQNIALISMLEDKDKIDAIKLSTLHAAKGLEYPYVYLIGCEEGILPHQESIDNLLEEERRLMYVGVTRAQKELTISYCQQRRQGGELQTRERSRFIDEMGANNILDEIKNPKIASGELKSKLESLRNLLN